MQKIIAGNPNAGIVIRCRFNTCMGLLLLISFSCGNKKINMVESIPQGTYKGVFLRSSPLAKYAPSNVTLTFTENKFSGESGQTHYPAICNGTYRVTGSEIEFTNECMWTADFDWTYILKDKFKIRREGDKLEMTKSVDDHTDQYTLTFQKL